MELYGYLTKRISHDFGSPSAEAKLQVIMFMLVRSESKGNTLPLLVGVKTCTTFEINLVISQKTKNTSTSRSSYTIACHIPKRCPTLSQGHLVNYVHSCFIRNSQQVETT